MRGSQETACVGGVSRVSVSKYSNIRGPDEECAEYAEGRWGSRGGARGCDGGGGEETLDGMCVEDEKEKRRRGRVKKKTVTV